MDATDKAYLQPVLRTVRLSAAWRLYREMRCSRRRTVLSTIWLEREREWTGLLVERDPYFYTQLIGKKCQSWSINACLSPQPYVTQIPAHMDYSIIL